MTKYGMILLIFLLQIIAIMGSKGRYRFVEKKILDIEKYKEELLKTSNTYDIISEYVQPYIPSYLFKYGSFNSKHWEDQIFKGQLRLTKASDFNDPFDCLAVIDTDKVLKSTYITGLLKVKIQNLYDPSLQLDIYQFKKDVIFGLQSDIRAICFSEVWNSILMWGHYADCHKGFCIEYDANSLSNLKRRRLYPALYQEEQIDVTNDILYSTANAGLISMVGKAKEWNYEKEWRMVYAKEPSSEFLYFRKNIRSVILGIKCEKKYIDKVCEWAIKESKMVYQAKIDPGKYEILRERII